MNYLDLMFFKPPGSASFENYLAHKGGMELFRAYIEHRTGDGERNAEKERQIIERLSVPFSSAPWSEDQDPNAPAVLGIDPEAEELTRELLQLHIMKELDSIIRDLLEICVGQSDDNNILAPNELLVDLRRALKIGRGHAPSDSTRIKRQREIEKLWIKAYFDMYRTLIFRSDSSIAEDIVRAIGVSKRTAFNCWVNLKECEPSAAHIANTVKIIKWGKRAHDAKTKPTVKKKRPDFKF